MRQGDSLSPVPKQVIEYYAHFGLDEQEVGGIYGPVGRGGGPRAAVATVRTPAATGEAVPAPCSSPPEEVPSPVSPAPAETAWEEETVAGGVGGSGADEAAAPGQAGPWAAPEGAVEAAEG